MNVLLRERRARADGIDEYLDTEVDTASIDVGSGPDQTLQLIGSRIAARHARITLDGTQARVTCRRGRRVLVNGVHVRTAKLLSGDVVEIDGNRLTLAPPPAGFDFALEITRNAAAQSRDFAGAFRIDLAQTWLSKRRAAWLLFALIAAFALLLPLGQLVWDSNPAQRPWSPADAQWSTGPLHPAHQLAIGDDCGACHAEPFERVRDAQCTACHDHTHDHVDAALATNLGFEHTRCATCHREHNSPQRLVDSSVRTCTQCHGTPSHDSTPTVELTRATGFSVESHPAFRAYLLRASQRNIGTGLVFDWHYAATSIADGREASNLKFPHDVHLDPDKVKNGNDSAPLGCADCHALAADDEHFEPVTMERHCASCHDLKFDTTDPTRELPHAAPAEAILAIEGHYLRKFGDPNLGAQTDPKRRVPDRAREGQRCVDSVFACAMRATRDEALNQFTQRGCITCHRVDDAGGDDIYNRFQVYPVRLVSDYLPAAHFNHVSHLTQKGATGDAACASCHAAAKSSDSADLMIPDIDNCVQCHSADERNEARPVSVELACIGCHAYHPDASLIALRGER